MTPAQAFDSLAANYDRLWTHAPSGRLQREAVWAYARPYLQGAKKVLDIGCGTGEDACRLMRAGVRVTAIDISAAMVAAARAQGVDARVLAAEELEMIEDHFDAAISNFGVLNCVADLASLRDPLARIVKPRGYTILCLLSRFCLWETVWFLFRGKPRKAVRRWSGAATTSGGLRVYYPRVRDVQRAFAPRFTLVGRRGIGIRVPPSCRKLPEGALRRASAVDQRISAIPGFRACGDHTLLIFRRSR
jgi:ubiquinone/menaquinone biosynthesis C-methylase UbiE